MAEEAAKEEENKEENKAEGAETSEEEAQQSSGMGKLLVIVGGVVVIVLGIVGALFLTPAGQRLLGIEEPTAVEGEKTAKKGDEEAEEEAEEDPEEDAEPIDLTQIAFVEVPEILVNLRTDKRKTGFLKLAIKIEVKSKEDAKTIEHLVPRIIDQLQVYLRGVDTSDLEGHAGAERLRNALVERINSTTTPIKVTNVLFNEFLVQ